MQQTPHDIIKILVQPYGKRGHHPVTVYIEWGNLPKHVRNAIGYWMVLRHAGLLLANWDGPMPEEFTVQVQELMEQALLEQQE